jgi:ribosomal protein L20
MKKEEKELFRELWEARTNDAPRYDLDFDDLFDTF